MLDSIGRAPPIRQARYQTLGRGSLIGICMPGPIPNINLSQFREMVQLSFLWNALMEMVKLENVEIKSFSGCSVEFPQTWHMMTILLTTFIGQLSLEINSECFQMSVYFRSNILAVRDFFGSFGKVLSHFVRIGPQRIYPTTLHSFISRMGKVRENFWVLCEVQTGVWLWR
jgi:hypothetical protein